MAASTERPLRSLRFGLCTDQNAPFDSILSSWQYFEHLGFDSAWVCDHLIQPSRPTGPYFEAWTLLAALAARTSRIRVGVLVTSNTFRHPAVLAKQAIAVDHVSRGRLEMGLGAGWYQPEHDMYGIRFPPTQELVSRFSEAVRVLDLLLREEVSSFAGRYYNLSGALSRPSAVQKPRPPFVLGAFGPRMLKIAAKYADTWTAFGAPTEMAERNELLDYLCTVEGRDPNRLRRLLYVWSSATADPWDSVEAFEAVIGPYVEAGMDHFVFDQPRPEQHPTLERIVATVLPGLRNFALRPRGAVTALPISSTTWSRPATYLAHAD